MQTKEEKSEYNKKWREKNKEHIAAYNHANKERKAAYIKANKEKLDAYCKAYKESQKDGLYTVYYLKEEHYAGMTSNLSYRLSNHKTMKNRHIEDVEIIGKYKTKKEATRVEAALHSMGYLGRHPNYKQQTLKEVL